MDAPKVPLLLRRDLRDHEQDKQAVLAKLTSVVGSPVTFNWDVPTAYQTVLAASPESAAQFYRIMVSQLRGLASALSDTYKDPLVKAELEDAWSTHNVSVVVLDDKAFALLQDDKFSIGSSQLRIRIVDGQLQLVMPPRGGQCGD